MLSLVLFWVWFCAYLNCAGWTLSVLHQLNAEGYAVALAAGLVTWLVWKKKTSSPLLPRIHWQKYPRRFRRPFPFAFLVLAALAFLGGALYAPTNYDALAYRLPRVLHWLAADQWHWIHTIFPRLNNRSCGIEWVSAPFIALLHTDRLLFCLNLISFLLLPGLVFSVFTRLGVRRRAAWHWMWIAPTGYCFLLQAGSIGNDLFGATFALAAVDFALRAKNSEAARDIFTAILAAAMMTGAKTASLPLLLPCALALVPSLKRMFRWPLRTVAVCVIGIFASALPTVFLNAKFSGDWSGANLHSVGIGRTEAVRVSANAISLVTQNLVPPVFPLANKWNAEVLKAIPETWESRLRLVMLEAQAYEFSLPEMQIEENAGLGFGVSVLLLASVVAAGFARREKTRPPDSVWWVCVRWSPWISLLALMTQYNLSVFCRILTPYYLLLMPALLIGGAQERLVKNRGWRLTAFAILLLAAGLMIISPPRPLYPIQTILAKISNPDSHTVMRIKEVYSVYHERSDAFAPALAALPPGLKILGLITYDDPETSLWRPFGSRRIEHVCPADTAADLKARGIKFILLRDECIEQYFPIPLDGWLKQMNAQVVQKIPLNLRASCGPLEWSLVRLN